MLQIPVPAAICGAPVPGGSLGSLSTQLQSRRHLLDILIPHRADLWQPQMGRGFSSQEQQPLIWSLEFKHFISCQEILQIELQGPHPEIMS